MVHDTGKCVKEFDLEAAFQGLPLKHWTRIGHRQPYIGVFTAKEPLIEKFGDREEQLRLFIREGCDKSLLPPPENG